MTDARRAFTPPGVLEAVGLPAHNRGAARLACFVLGRRVGMKHERHALPAFPGSVVNFRSRERKGAFGRAAPVRERAGERTEQKAEWSGGFRNSSRERQRGSASLRVSRRSLSRGIGSSQSCAKGWAMGRKGEHAGAAMSCLAA